MEASEMLSIEFCGELVISELLRDSIYTSDLMTTPTLRMWVYRVHFISIQI